MVLFRRRTVPASCLVVEGVLSMLARSELRPMQSYPSPAELRRRYGVGRRAVRRATEVLRAVGIVEVRRHGRLFLTTQADDPGFASEARQHAAIG